MLSLRQFCITVLLAVSCWGTAMSVAAQTDTSDETALSQSVLSSPNQSQSDETDQTSNVLLQTSNIHFGYFSYSSVLQSMSEMAIVKTKVDALRQQYADEMQRVEEEFNKKYEEFLEGQRTFAPAIYKKRQAELTELMQHNIAFKQQAQQQLLQAEAELQLPLRERLAAVVQTVAKQRSLAFVLNTDGDALPYVDPALGEDITDYVKSEIAK